MQVDSLELQIKTNADAAANSIEHLKNSLKGIRTACTSYAKGLERVNETLKQLGTSTTANLTQSIEGVKGGMTEVSATAYKTSLDLEKTGKSLKATGEKAKESKKGLAVFFKQLKRIAVYRLIRSALKAISTMLREGIQNVAKFDKAMGNIYGYNTALSELKSSWVQLKNTMGVFVANVVQLVTPVLVALMKVIMQVVEAVNILWATLAGKDKYLKANDKYWEDYADGLDNANGSAKALKRTLLGFDELNVLGNDSGGTSTNIADMFIEADVGDRVKRTAEDMKELFIWYDKINRIDPPNGGMMFAPVLVGAESFFALYKKLKEYLDKNPLKIEMPTLDFQPALNSLGMFLEGLNTGIQTLASNILIFTQNVSLIYNTIIVGIQTAFANIVTFCTTSIANIKLWAVNVATNVAQAITIIADNIYSGLQNACTNIANFVTNTSSNIANWCKNLVSNTANAIRTFVDNFVSGLKTAWQNFKSWCSATGSAISGFYQENKTTILTSAAFAGVVGLAIALAPFTGGASLALAAFADGGMPDAGSLFLAGEAGPELVTQIGGRNTVYNEEQLGNSLAYANQEVVNAILSSASSIMQSIAENKTEVNIGDREIARAASRGSKLTGNSLIQGA